MYFHFFFFFFAALLADGENQAIQCKMEQRMKMRICTKRCKVVVISQCKVCKSQLLKNQNVSLFLSLHVSYISRFKKKRKKLDKCFLIQEWHVICFAYFFDSFLIFTTQIFPFFFFFFFFFFFQDYLLAAAASGAFFSLNNHKICL